MLGRIGLLALALISVGAPAFASLKTGIDAYQRGDYSSAVGIWRPLAVAGDADAQYNIAQAYRLGRGVPVDPQMAESWLKKAADQRHPRARNAYGLTLYQNGRRAEAIPFIEESAASGFPQSQYVYATLLFNGDIVAKDWVRAYALMMRAAAGDVAAAKAALTQLDQHIPFEQRQRGLRLAETFASAAPKAPDAIGTPITVAALPPSNVLSIPVIAVTIPTVASSAWRIQLGAFGKAESASVLWRKLQTRIDALSPYRNYLIPTGKVTLLQAGPLPTQAAAAKLCTAIKASGNECLVVGR